MPRWSWIVGGAALLLAAIIFLFPLRPVLERHGIVADDISGSIWHGRITGANWHGIALGDLETTGRAWPPAMEVTGPVIRGRLTASGVEALSGSISDIPGLPLTEIAVQNVTVRLDKTGCSFAGGTVAVYATPIPALGAISGPLRCENGVLRASLVPESGDALVDLSLTADRRYQAILRLGSLPATVRLLMIAAGFEATETGVSLSRSGQL